MCSTEANLEVVEVLMFLAGSYSEIWGSLFYSVNILYHALEHEMTNLAGNDQFLTLLQSVVEPWSWAHFDPRLYLR